MAGLNWQVAEVLYSDGKRVRLRFSRPEFCQRCQRGQGCGAGVFSRLFVPRASEIEIECAHRLTAGQWVRVGFAHRTLAQAAAVTYGLPLMAFVAGALPAHWLVSTEGWRDLWALTGGLVAAAIVLSLGKRLAGCPAAPALEPLSCGATDTKSMQVDE